MYDERFARQYRYEPPSEFPLTWPCSGIVHHLSGPNRNAQTQTSINQLVGCTCKDPGYHFHCVNSLNTNKLANLLDSLVRVSRRVKQKQLVSIIVPRFTDCSSNGFEKTNTDLELPDTFLPIFTKDMQSNTHTPMSMLRSKTQVFIMKIENWHVRKETPRTSQTTLQITFT